MLFSHILDKIKETARRFRVIVGHVVVLQSNLETLGQRPMTLVLWMRLRANSSVSMTGWVIFGRP